MPDPLRSPSTATPNTPTSGPILVSFVLRCRVEPDGAVRASLVDVQSGIPHPVTDLADLPERIRQLLALRCQLKPAEEPP